MLLNAACNLKRLYVVEYEVTVKILPNHYLSFICNYLICSSIMPFILFPPSFSAMIKVRFTAHSSHSHLQKYTLYSGEATPLL